ncbi:MAG: TIR domain-containing protein [Pyrinomonadaceae bacterium]
MAKEQPIIKWILVAGTGKIDLPQEVNWCSREVGKSVALQGCGLVAGGWSGVDYVVAESFSKELNPLRKSLSSYLIQVVPKNMQPQFKGGEIVYVEPGVKEWIESARYADAVILIGGLGGTYETYLFALQEQKPVFPLAATEGDARKAYNDILDHWNLQPIKGISKEEFQETLARPINTEADANLVTSELMGLIERQLEYTEDTEQAKRNIVFISYSHKDRRWLTKLRTMLKPLERQKGINIWDDTAIEAGQKWNQEIQAALGQTRVVVFLVSPNFLASDFIDNHELNPLLKAAEERQVTILWVYLSACLHEETGLIDYQAAHDISKPLDSLSPAKQNAVLVDVSKKIKSAIGI